MLLAKLAQESLRSNAPGASGTEGGWPFTLVPADAPVAKAVPVEAFGPVIAVKLPEVIEPWGLMKLFGIGRRYTLVTAEVSLDHGALTHLIPDFRPEDYYIDFVLYMRRGGAYMGNLRMFNVHIGADPKDGRYDEVVELRDGRAVYQFTGRPRPVHENDILRLALADEFGCYLDICLKTGKQDNPYIASTRLPLQRTGMLLGNMGSTEVINEDGAARSSS